YRNHSGATTDQKTRTMIKLLIGILTFTGIAVTMYIPGVENHTAQDIAGAPQVWSAEKANEWYEKQDWLVGANFNPASAINQLEMWQKETFDPERIDLELSWAEDLGMNTMRVYLHDLVYRDDPDGLLGRMDEFLGIVGGHGIRPGFVVFYALWDAYL